VSSIPLDRQAPNRRANLSRSKRLAFAGVVAVMAIAVLVSLGEGLSQIVLGLRYGWQRRPKTDQDSTLEYDPLLGWRPKSSTVLKDWFGKGQTETTNGQGFRATREYTAEVPGGRYRIICLGDSFTHGVGGDHETYPAQLERLSPSIEAVNMGRGAYGIDQLYLWYMRDGQKLRTNMLLFAFIEDDFDRMTSDTFRTLRPKPQLVMRGNTLAVVNVPVPTWTTVSSTGWLEEFPRRMALYQVLHRAQERLFSHYDMHPIVARVFAELKALSLQRQQQFVLVYLPSFKDAPGSGRGPREIAQDVERIARDQQIPFVNLTSMFEGSSPSQIAPYFLPDEHYSSSGNRLVATTLLKWLRARFPEVPR
jgi:hypothetical protein